MYIVGSCCFHPRWSCSWFSCNQMATVFRDKNKKTDPTFHRHLTASLFCIHIWNHSTQHCWSSILINICWILLVCSSTRIPFRFSRGAAKVPRRPPVPPKMWRNDLTKVVGSSRWSRRGEPLEEALNLPQPRLNHVWFWMILGPFWGCSIIRFAALDRKPIWLYVRTLELIPSLRGNWKSRNWKSKRHWVVWYFWSVFSLNVLHVLKAGKHEGVTMQCLLLVADLDSSDDSSRAIHVFFFPTCQVRVVPHLPGEGC